MTVMATLLSGNQVPAFFDWHSSKKAGYLSRTGWKEAGLLVPEEAIPAAIVVLEQANSWFAKGMFEPILNIECTEPNWVKVAHKFYYVFTREQTIPKPTKNKGGKGTRGEGSLMTEKTSKVLEKQGDNASQNKYSIESVNNVRSYVPEGLLDLDNCSIRHEVWYFLGVVYWKHLEQRLNWGEPVNLKVDYLKENIPNWPCVWDYCEHKRLVERIGGYAVGYHSYGYRTCSPYREQTHRLVTFEHKLLAKRLRKANQQFWNRPVLTYLRDQLDRISVDMDLFSTKFGSHPNKHYYLAHLQTICDKEIRFTQDDFSGRVHTNITNLYKPLRALLRVDGLDEPLGEIDIKNSQPLFLGIAAKKRGVIDQAYLEHCQTGTIYDHLANRVSVLRESAKAEFVKMLYAKNGYRSLMKSVFELEFPTIAKLIHQLKVKDHRRLAKQMQEAERKFMIDTVVARLLKERKGMFITTIHDAIIAQADNCEFIKQVMLEEFMTFGICPNLDWQQLRSTP